MATYNLQDLIPVEQTPEISLKDLVPVAEKPPSLETMTTGQKIVQAPRALAETGASLLTGIAGALGGAGTKLVTGALTGDREAANFVGEKVAEALSFQPTTPMAQEFMSRLSPWISAPAEIGKEAVNLPMESLGFQGFPRVAGEVVGEFAPYAAVGAVPKGVRALEARRIAPKTETPATPKTVAGMEGARGLLKEAVAPPEAVPPKVTRPRGKTEKMEAPIFKQEELIPIEETPAPPVQAGPQQMELGLDSINEVRPPEVAPTPAPAPVQPVQPGSVVTYRGKQRVVTGIDEQGNIQLNGSEKFHDSKYIRATGLPAVDLAEVQGLEWKLHKAGYTAAEIRKMAISDKTEAIRQLKEAEAAPPDPAILQKQTAVHNAILENIRQRNIADIAELKARGYTEEQIAGMADRNIRETAAALRGEKQTTPTKAVQSKMDEFDKAIAELGDRDISQLSDEEITKVVQTLDSAEPYASEVIESLRDAWEKAAKEAEEGITDADLDAIARLREERAAWEAEKAGEEEALRRGIEQQVAQLEEQGGPIDLQARRKMIEKAAQKLKEKKQPRTTSKEGGITKVDPYTEEMYRATLEEQNASVSVGRRRRPAAETPEDWEAKLAEEGMPEELDFNRQPLTVEEQEAKMGVYSKLLDQVLNILDSVPFGRSEKGISDAIDFASRRFSGLDAPDIVDNLAKARADFRQALGLVYKRDAISNPVVARNIQVASYKWLPSSFNKGYISKASYLEYLKDMEKKTGLVDKVHRTGSDVNAEINNLELLGKLTKGEADYMRAITKALGPKANFYLTLDLGGRGGEIQGYYSFARNVAAIRQPKTFLHEVGHFVHNNFLSGADRIQFAESILNQFYKGGELDRVGLRKHLGNNNIYESLNLNEIFATEFSNYLGKRTFMEGNRGLYEKAKVFLQRLLNQLKNSQEIPADRQALYDRIMQAANAPETKAGRPRGRTETQELFEPELRTSMRLPHQEEGMRLPKMDDIDKVGLKQTSDYLKSVWTRLRRDADQPGLKVVGEVTGADPANPQTIFQQNAAIDRGLWRQWIQMSSAWAKGTPVEGIEFKTYKADSSSSFNHANNITTLRELERYLKKNGVSKEDLTGIVRGDKSPATQAQAEAAGRVRDWLDFMRDRYRDFLKGEYVRWLSKGEAAALTDVIQGKDFVTSCSRHRITDPEKLLDIVNKYKDLDNWGLDDYLPKVELGSYRIDIELEDARGKPYKKTVHVALSQKDAVAKITDWLEKNPDYTGSFYIDTSGKGILSDVTGLTTKKQYYSIMNKLAKAINAEVEGISKGMAQQIAKGITSRKFAIKPTDKFSEFALDRRDILEGEKDIFPVLYKYSRVMEKKMALDPVIHEFKMMKDKLPPNLREMTEDMLEAAKGKYWWPDKMADQILGAVHGKLEAKGFDVGPPPAMTISRITGKLRGFEANVKLGYRPANAFINWASGQGHTWTKVGEQAILEANRLRNTAEGRALLDELGQYMGMSFAEESTGKFTARTEWWKPLGMFQKAEPINRETSILANYLIARRTGLSVEAAKEAAIQGNRFQNFVYNVSSLPKSMRGPLAKTILQFKPYLVQELHFIASLRGPQIARYLTMQLALGGPRGAVMVMKSMPFIGAFIGWDELERWLNTNYPRASRGIPGAADVDLSAMASFQFPGSAGEWGPTLSDFANLYKEIGKPLMEGSLEPQADILQTRAKKVIDKNVPFMRHWLAIWDNVITGDGYVRDEEGKIRTEAPLYSPSDDLAKRTVAKAGYAARRIAGAETIQESASKVEERIDEREEANLNKRKAEVGDQISTMIRRGEEVPQGLWDSYVELQMKEDALTSRLEESWRTPMERRLRRRNPPGQQDVVEHAPELY